MTNEISIKENRRTIFLMIIFLGFLAYIISILFFSLSTMELYHPNLILYYSVLALIGFAVLLLISELVMLLLKLIHPYSISISMEGFHDTSLRQLIPWSNVDNVGYLSLNKVSQKTLKLVGLFFTLAFILALLSPASFFELLRLGTILSTNELRIPIIYTQNKNDLMKNATFISKLEMFFYPKNMIRISFEEGLTSITSKELIDVMQSHISKSKMNEGK